MIKEYALDHIHWRIARDPWTIALFESAGLQFDNLAQEIVNIYRFNDFRKLPAEYVEYYEDLLGIRHNEDASLDERRSAIESRWKGGIAPTNEGIQSVCNGWKSGECSVGFDSDTAKVVITFTSEFGVPTDIADLETALRKVIPAHLGVEFVYNFYLISDIHEEMTIAEIETKTLDKFAR